MSPPSGIAADPAAAGFAASAPGAVLAADRAALMRAAGWMVGAIVSFAAMAVAGRELAAEFDTFEIMAYRSAVGLPLMLLAIWWAGAWGALRPADPRGQATRHVIHFAAQNAWFYGVAAIPLAQLVAIEFTSPIWIALLAPAMLGERLTRTGLAAAGLGFVGILVVARPGIAPLEAGHAAALAAAVGFAVTNILTKRLARTDSALCILFWMTAIQLVLGLVCAAPGGIAVPSAALVPWVLFTAVSGLTAHFSLTRALAEAPASRVAPMEFMRLPVIAVAAALLYGEALEVAVFAGAALILAGNLINMRARGA